MKALVAAVVALLVAGCATGPSLSQSGGSVPAPAPGQARVWFYRTIVIGAAYQPEVTLDGRVVGRAVPRGVFYADVAPGAHDVTTSMTKEVVHLDLAAGQQAYVRLGYSFGFNIFPERVDAAVASAEMRDLSYTGGPAAPAAKAGDTAGAQPAAVSRADYTGTLRCGAYEGSGRVESPGPWEAFVHMHVADGLATMERGDGKYSESVTGRVAGSTLALDGQGAMAATPNAPWRTQVRGDFAEGGKRFRGDATLATTRGEVFRRCRVDLVAR